MLRFTVQSEVVFRSGEHRIDVHSDFFEGEKKVHEVNYSYPQNTSQDDILEDIRKAGRLFEQEAFQSLKQKEIDEKLENLNAISTNIAEKSFEV